MNLWFIIFTYAIILLAGCVIGAGAVGFFWLRAWLHGQIEKLKNVKVEIVDEQIDRG